METATRAARPTVSFETSPERYKHWKLTFDGPIATLSMDVQENAGLRPDYRLKLNSYDLAVDIELADAIQRIRFEHPDTRVVVITSLKERVCCAGPAASPAWWTSARSVATAPTSSARSPRASKASAPSSGASSMPCTRP